MSTTQTVLWTTESETDKALHDAVTKLSGSTDQAIKQTPQGQPNTFVLASQSYFDLQAYVMTGEEFPLDESAFDRHITKDAFKKLTDVDADIYLETRTPMIGIGKSCAEFHRDHLGRLLNAAKAAMAYVETTTEKLIVDDGMSLCNQLDTLMDPKYNSSADLDDDFEDAKAVAVQALADLKNDADTKKTEVDGIVVALSHFKNETMKYQPMLQKLKEKYKGPTINAKTNDTPYLTWLSSDLADVQKKLDKAISDASNEYHTGIRIIFLMDPMGGWVVASMKENEKNDPIRNAYINMKAGIKAFKNELGDEWKLYSAVSMLMKQCEGIMKKMENAITALGKLSSMFGEQASCYSVISTYLSELSNTTNYKGLKVRTKAINSSVQKTVKKLKELNDVAGQFTHAINNQTKVNLEDI